MKKVYIVAGGDQYHAMYQGEGYEVVADLDDADLVQFTGGEDVNPALYNCGIHIRTFANPLRDEEEQDIYQRARNMELPMVGICRGGQFLNVMNGGRMFQHVDGHAIQGTHKAVDVTSGATFSVTSTHHQMMIPDETGTVLLRVPDTLCSYKEYVDKDGELQVVVPDGSANDADVESVFYPFTKSLCFQPHPEYEDGKACRNYFFGLIEGHLFHKWDRYEKVTGYNPYDEEEDFVRPMDIKQAVLADALIEDED